MTLPSRLVKSFKFCSIINPNFLKLGDTFKQTRVFSMPHLLDYSKPGAVYLSQNLQFKQPVYIGEEICGEVEAISMRDFKKKHLVKFSTRCFKQDSLLVLDGEAMAILPTLQLE
ncbi:3-hydroxyacyl-[acyl-carrier-protein] dehydratase, mitochondrial-like isoform X2 [Silene latifolia]|uniref:3-hydroxyacyl-[acyl-carrier-protein] dehydratase, mitochondrial-like isoform X2 n=1 Tax=Silene latifolia TaxID=37657 RepID=UPI003D78965D